MGDQRHIRLDSGARTVREPRVDRVAVRKVEKTPVGGRRVEAGMVRRGQVLEYQRADGTTVRELVSAEAAAAPVAGAAVTVMHPGGGTRLVTPETYRQDAVGVVISDASFDGDVAVATFDVNDASAIARVDSGELCEVSLGYVATIAETPGVAPDGTRYDAVQVAREVNHAALLPRGAARAGSDAALRLDGAAIAIDEQTSAAPAAHAERKSTMKTERIDGVDYVVGSAEWQQAHAKRMARIDADEAELKAKIAELEAQLATAKEELAGKTKALDDKSKELDEATDETKMDARIAARTALIQQARGVLGAEVKLDGKTSDQIRREVLTKLDGAGCVEGKDANHVAIYFEARLKARGADLLAQSRSDALPVVPTAPSAPSGAPATDLSAYLVRPGDRI